MYYVFLNNKYLSTPVLILIFYKLKAIFLIFHLISSWLSLYFKVFFEEIYIYLLDNIFLLNFCIKFPIVIISPNLISLIHTNVSQSFYNNAKSGLLKIPRCRKNDILFHYSVVQAVEKYSALLRNNCDRVDIWDWHVRYLMRDILDAYIP